MHLHQGFDQGCTSETISSHLLLLCFDLPHRAVSKINLFLHKSKLEGVLQPVTGIQPKEAETVRSKNSEIHTVRTSCS